MRAPTGQPARIARMIAATTNVEFVSTATETEALLLEANLIKRLRPRFNVLLRDDKSFPYILITGDHWAPQILKHRGARARPGQLFRSVRLGRRRRPHHQRAAARLPDPLLHRRVLREPHAAVPALPDQALLGALHREIDFAGYTKLVREAKDFLSGHSQAVKAASLRGEMEQASGVSISSAPRVYRDRLAALSAIQAQQGINPRTVEEADVFAIHQDGGYSCVQVFFFRTGQNWGNRAYFPRADRSRSTPDEVLGAFLAQFYDDKPAPKLILLSHEIEEARAAGRGAQRRRPATRSRSSCRSAARRRTWSITRSPMRARRSAASSPRPRRNGDCSQASRRRFGLPRAPRRIEVYDNSHIQGTNAGRRHDRRRAGRLRQEPVPQVQHPLGGPHARRRLRHDARGAAAPLHAAARRANGPRRSSEAPKPSGDDDAAPPWPDLVLIDGGRGQLNAAREIFQAELGLDRGRR